MTIKKGNPYGSGIFILFVILSIFSGLILSIWAYIAKKSGKGYIIQLIFGLICILFFGYFSFYFYTNGSGSDNTSNEIFVYYIGMIGTYSNGIAALVWILTLFSKSNK